MSPNLYVPPLQPDFPLRSSRIAIEGPNSRADARIARALAPACGLSLQAGEIGERGES